jgi:hypothetical protein
MKKVWKWVIGVILGLVVIAVLVGVGFAVWNNMHLIRGAAEVNPGFSQRGPEMMPYGGNGWHLRGSGMMPYGENGWQARGPEMMGFRGAPFAGFFGGLLTLGFLVLVVLGIVWLVVRLRSPKPVVATPSVPAVVSEPIPAAALNPCKKCGRPLQADWVVCPHCGKKV